jgi:hypothetical protein
MTVMALALRIPQNVGVFTHDEILDELIAQLASGRIKAVDVARAIGQPAPRVSEIKNRARRIQPDEMKPVAELLGMVDEATPVPPLPSEESIGRLLQALFPSMPKTDDLSDRAASALAVALRHGLATLPDPAATDPSESDLAAAARAAVFRYREVGSA